MVTRKDLHSERCLVTFEITPYYLPRDDVGGGEGISSVLLVCQVSRSPLQIQLGEHAQERMFLTLGEWEDIFGIEINPF